MPLFADLLQLDPQATPPVNPPDGTIWYDPGTDQAYLMKAGVPTPLVTLGAPGSGGLVQSGFDELHNDTSITSTSWVDLLSVDITTQGNTSLFLSATTSALTTSSGKAYYLRILVDDAPVRGACCYPGTSTYAHSCGLEAKKTVGAGEHTVKLQWKVSGGTLRCRPDAYPDQEHASLYVEEVSV